MDLCYQIPESVVKEHAEEGPCLDVRRRLSAMHGFLTALKARDVDLLRPCSKTEKNAAPCCWIASKLLVLNGVLENVLLELREDVPGVLSLVTLSVRGLFEYPDDVITDATFLVSWLLCYHSCVQTVHLDNSTLLCQFSPTVIGRTLRRSSGVVDLKLSLRSSVQRTLQALPVLVSALQYMVDLETLDLGGLALDRSIVDSLIALLKIARLRVLVLGNCTQEKKAALKLSRALRNCTCLTSLAINDRVRGLPEAAFLLKKNFTLQSVSLSGVTGELVGEILLCLACNNTLEELCLSDAALGDYPVPIAPIYAFAANRRLRVLKLTRLELGDPAAMAFAELLRDNETLEEIDFSGSCVEDFGGNALAEALEVNRSLKIICLTQSQLDEDTVTKFARTLSKNQHLERVNLGIVSLPEDWRLWNDDCDFPMIYERLEVTWNTWGLQRIASCMSAVSSELLLHPQGGLLRLSWTRRTNIDGVRAVLGAASGVTFLNELTLESTHSDERGFAEAIAALLISTKTLKKLEITEAINSIHVVVVILRAFEHNSTVCTARFACSLSSPSIANALKIALNVNRTLHSIAFRSLNLHPKSLARFVSGIQGNNVLTDLSFDYLFDEKGMRQLRDLLWRNRCLLSRAVKYAQQTAADVESMKAFKTLAGRDSLLCALKKATGKTAAECENIVTETSNKLL